ncbi:Uncharacterised protein [Vibrio cholerae]|nr:Uncharacterised protein [Vibrio cholerae]
MGGSSQETEITNCTLSEQKAKLNCDTSHI